MNNTDGARELAQHEVERLHGAFHLNRRDLMRVFGAGILVCSVGPAAALQESGRARQNDEEPPAGISSWLHIDESGHVTVYTGKVEMGQNIRTSLAQQVAEELRVPIDTISMVMGDTRQTPYDMGTFGSRTTPQMGTELRAAATAAREALIDMAAARLGVPRSSLVVDNGAVHEKTQQAALHPAALQGSTRAIAYGELTRGQAIARVIGENLPETPPAEWHVAGSPVAKVDGRAFVTGEHRYTSDVVRPGMKFGAVLRPDAFHENLVSLDASGADGVQVVHDGDFVGVVASDEASAHRAVHSLRAQWSSPPAQTSDTELYSYLKDHPAAASKSGSGQRHERSEHRVGSVERALPGADVRVQTTYTVAYIQHAPLEPRAAVAEWANSELTVWTGTQRPFAVREELAHAFNLPIEKVRVMVPDTGAAYGGKHTGEAAVEAARLAKAARVPVKLVWTRQEEFTWAYFRPAGVIDVRAGASHDGTVVSWEHDNYNSGPAAITTPYAVANQRITFHPTEEPLRQGSYRALAATANHFARESAMDELAHALQMDPLEFRLQNLNHPRLREVFQRAAARFGWGKPPSSPDHGFGIAGGFEKGGYVATCAEVAVDRSSGAVRILRVVEAFDCGPVVNPNGLRNQIAGAVVQGIGGALFEHVRFANGRILNPHFAQYRVPRFRDYPQIEVELIDRKDERPFGAGETPIVGLAPAVGNAIFHAIGKRMRSMPMAPEGVIAA